MSESLGLEDFCWLQGSMFRCRISLIVLGLTDRVRVVGFRVCQCCGNAVALSGLRKGYKRFQDCGLTLRTK